MHSAYPVIAGRFKDYISTPKSNGYQSLHTGVTLREPRNQKIEIQIRTADMDDIAENGVAAHWVYKEPDAQGRPARMQRFRWVQDLLEILENSSSPDEFLENTKLELYQDQVFCFTPKGQLIQLPRGVDAGRFRLCGALARWATPASAPRSTAGCCRCGINCRTATRSRS